MQQKYENKLSEIETLAAQVAQLEESLEWCKGALSRALEEKAEHSSRIKELTAKLNQCIAQREGPADDDGSDESDDEPEGEARHSSRKSSEFKDFQSRIQYIFEQRAAGTRQLSQDDAATLAHCFAELVEQCSESSGVAQPEGFDMGILPVSIASYRGPGPQQPGDEGRHGGSVEDNRFDREDFDSCIYEAKGASGDDIETDQGGEPRSSRKRDSQDGKVELESGSQLVQEEGGTKKSRAEGRSESTVPVPSSDSSDAGVPPKGGGKKDKKNKKKGNPKPNKTGGGGA